jgi:hypothetical protein
MAAPKLTKPSELRSDLYNTLDRVAKGEKHIVPMKGGEVMIISLAEFEAMRQDLEDLKEFEEPIVESQLVDAEVVFSRLARKHGLTYEDQVFKKSRKRSR